MFSSSGQQGGCGRLPKAFTVSRLKYYRNVTILDTETDLVKKEYDACMHMMFYCVYK